MGIRTMSKQEKERIEKNCNKLKTSLILYMMGQDPISKEIHQANALMAFNELEDLMERESLFS